MSRPRRSRPTRCVRERAPWSRFRAGPARCAASKPQWTRAIRPRGDEHGSCSRHGHAQPCRRVARRAVRDGRRGARRRGAASAAASAEARHAFGTAAGLRGCVAEHGPHIVERFVESRRASLRHAPDLMPDETVTIRRPGLITTLVSTVSHARPRDPPGPPLAPRRPGLHRDGARHAGARDRREHVDVLDPERHPAAGAALPGVRTARARLSDDRALADAAALAGQLPRSSGSEHGVRRPGRGVVDELRAGRARPPGRARRRDDRHRRLLHGARCPARHRPGADARRRSAGPGQRHRPERHLLAAALLGRSDDRGPGRASRRPAGHRRRGHAAGVRRPSAVGRRSRRGGRSRSMPTRGRTAAATGSPSSDD